MSSYGNEAKTVLEEREEVFSFFEVLEKFVHYSGLVLGGVFFTWLVVGPKEWPLIVSNTDPEFIWKLAIILYYASWMVGSRFDLQLQKKFYVSLGWAKDEKWPKSSIATLAILFVVAALLIWSEGKLQVFALVLCVFVIVDHATWRYLIYRSRKPVEKSMAFYTQTKNYIKLEKLKIVVYQLHGDWKWRRLCVGVPITALIVAFAFSKPVRSSVDAVVQLAGIASGELDSLVSGLLVLAFVLSVEIWSWKTRFNTLFSLKLLDELGHRYVLQPINPST